ncbi:MAG: family 16 glycosylhydrolase [Bacteroidales bacterium]|nr:family 16 glycosylhydrolase [Bacteroidales bacterium]
MICNVRHVIILLITAGIFFPLRGQGCYELVWSDEFNDSGLPDSSVWSYEVGAGGWGNNEWQYYTSERIENARVEDGCLIIEARNESYQGSNYTSARLISYRNNLYWQYGKVEARIKLPYGKGIWPAFWLMGRGIFEGISWPACGETDIVELIGGGEGYDDKVYGTAHWADAGGSHAQYGGSYQLPTGIFADTFHVFSIQWTASDMRWFVDGIQYQVIDITPAALSEFHNAFFILLNVAVGGNWPGYPNSTTVFPQQMKVDYVRVYQLNAEPQISGDTAVVKGKKNVQFEVPGLDDYSYEWTVPVDAVITSGQGSRSILVDWGCDSGTVKCNMTTDCKEYNLQHYVSIEPMEISGSEKVGEFQNNIVFSVPATRDASYQWIPPGEVTFSGDSTARQVSLNWSDKDGLLVLKLNDYCGSDSLIKAVSVIRQLPYPDPEIRHPIPGVIYSVNFDTGGEGIAYHDASAENEGTGSRQDEGVDTETNDGGENVGWIETGEWLEYSVIVGYSGTYDIEFRVASIDGTGKFALLMNGENRSATIAVPSTGAWNVFTSVIVRDVPLSVSDSLMRIEVISGDFNLGKMTFADSLASALDLPSDNQLMIYPVIVENELFVENIYAQQPYSLYDIRGQKAGAGMIFPGESINVTHLAAGIYFLYLGGCGMQGRARFIKVSENTK